MSPILLLLAGHFLALALIAFGGVGAITPEIHRVVVDQQHWLNGQEFVELFAIAQASPGPNVLFITLIGWKVAGIVGALVATVAICLPGAILTYVVSGFWTRFHNHPLRHAIQQGLIPLTVGLVCCTAIVMTRLADTHWQSGLLTLCAAGIAWRVNISPLWLLASGAALGASGYL